MISRLILSLRKAAASQHELVWTLRVSAADANVRFAGAQGFGVARDEIGLETFRSGCESGR